MKRAAIAVACLSLMTPRAFAVDPLSPVADGASLQKLAGDFKFTEGPSADAAGNVYFTDQPNNRIMKWSVDGKLSTFLQPAGRSNGLFFDNQGALWACADEENQLWKINVLTGNAEVVLRDRQGKLFNGPNDLWIHPQAGLYFTDPLYSRDYWTHRDPKAQLPRAVYHLSNDRQLTVVDTDVVQPNGIVGTSDGRILYVADIGAQRTYAYDIIKDGALANRHLFCQQGSDGMTIDDAGNVYLTGKGVQIYNTAGEKIAQIDVPENWTANVCFGGADAKTLFITASTGLYGLRMRTSGAQPR